MGLSLQTELAQMALLEGTFLSLTGLPEQTEPVPTTLKVDLPKREKLRTGTIQVIICKYSKFKLKSVEHAAFL